MTTDLTTIEPPTTVPAHASAMILQTVRDLDNAFRIATAVCATSFAPAQFRGKPEEGAAAILYGATIDMDPLTALQNIHVISGKPALYARAMVAVVLSHGHEMWTEEESEGRCVVAGRRKGSDKVHRVEWTTAMAERAGYTKNAKYQTDPRSMLYARASGDVARRVAPDALLGMAHNVEELTVDSVSQVSTVADAPRRPQLSAADFTAPAVESAPTPSPSAEDPEGSAPATDGLAVSDVQVERILVLGHELGLTTTQLITGIRKITGRDDIDDVRGLSEAEASTVIASLEEKATMVAPAAAGDVAYGEVDTDGQAGS